MKLSTLPENPLDAVALAAGLVPTPLLDTIIALLLARTVMVGTRLGVFEALAHGPLPAVAVAARCDADPHAMEKLLGALVGAGYLRVRAGRFTLRPIARKWLLRDSPHSLADALLLQFVDARFIEHTEAYVRTGQPVRMHEAMDAEEWGLYQRGMRSGARLSLAEVARRVPVPRRARALLDIGGSHGAYAAALCRRHPGLCATILDLPEAIEHAAPLLAREGMGERVVYRPGDARTADLGAAAYDLILIANLVHHFDDATNRDLARRAARALRPGGILVIGEVIRPSTPGAGGQIGALTDLYFAVTSEAGTWSFAEMAAWQRAAGLRPRRPIRLLTAPGGGLQAAVKPVE
ncbi:MAG: methyltransferase domain-containing protein [Ktedonobacterales bacterium]|nr:methyltransferase domain-containing protein [Ktedonobacterales bacterium]